MQIGASRYLEDVIVRIDSSMSPAGVALVYIGETGTHGLYYDKDIDDFAYNLNFGQYSSSTIASHINAALGTSFAGLAPDRSEEVPVTKDDILGKLIPVEP